jgi:hypothetical protein
MTPDRLASLGRLAAMVTGHIDWTCPNCPTSVTTPLLIPNRYHACPGLHGLVAPLVRAGADCKITALPREDYLNGEIQRTGDDGRPYGGVRVDRPDGSNDLVMFAPLARADAEGMGLR